MTFHPNSKKHKAEHGGYNSKPTKKEVKANLDFWAGMLTPGGIQKKETIMIGTPGSGIPKIGTQFKLF